MPPKSSKSSKPTKGTSRTSKPAKATKSTVEKLSDITDEVEDEEKPQVASDVDSDVEDAEPVEEALDDEVADEEEMPELEAVSLALKEKYEYNPIQRAKIIYVRPKDRITSEVMTKFEYAEVVSIRAKQLEDDDQPFTDVGDLQDPIEMAKKEIADKKCPLSVVRNRTVEGDTTIAELWQINEMAIPYD